VIGLGVDLVDVGRFRRTLARTPTLTARLFTPSERSYAEEARDPTQRYAVRFAAKEAVMKALGVGLGAIDWHDVEVRRAPSGAPSLWVGGRARALADDAGVGRWLVSLTHTVSTAEAVVIAVGS
jgi:phosphopantetheine--protein transferase-like protein